MTRKRDVTRAIARVDKALAGLEIEIDYTARRGRARIKGGRWYPIELPVLDLSSADMVSEETIRGIAEFLDRNIQP